LFIVAQLLPRLLGGKSSVATKTHSGEQKSNSKGQQALIQSFTNDVAVHSLSTYPTNGPQPKLLACSLKVELFIH
ncbi:hypothetical protein, partial [Pseudoalteromonas sp. Of11M-6]|uniref:hypothetical protein n=1 Tax=Pseudoalteromonas sp. Of11M-6 TaxID=2917754 RepID=UPI001EF70A6F